MPELGRILMVAGVALFLLGLALSVAGRLPWLGNLPGDIRWQRGGTTVFVPIGTMIVVSIVLSLLLNVIGRFFR